MSGSTCNICLEYGFTDSATKWSLVECYDAGGDLDVEYCPAFDVSWQYGCFVCISVVLFPDWFYAFDVVLVVEEFPDIPDIWEQESDSP